MHLPLTKNVSTYSMFYHEKYSFPTFNIISFQINGWKEDESVNKYVCIVRFIKQIHYLAL